MSDDRAGYIEGLRMLADALERHPDLPLPVQGVVVPVTWTFWSSAGDPKAAMALAAMALPARPWRKEYRDEDDPLLAKLDMLGTLGTLRVRLTAYRDSVCTKVVTGSHEVTEEVPDPEALARVALTTVTRVVEDVTWDCHPILSDGGTS
jgi:hypothetical protein